MTGQDLACLVAEPGANAFEYHDAAFPDRPLTLYSARPIQYDANTPILFVHHGVGRNGADYRDYWLPMIDEIGVLAIAVEFSEAAFPDYLWYHFGNMHAEDGTPNPREQWTYGVVERLFTALREQGVTKRRTYGLFGHSAGGQFVHRMLSFGYRDRVAVAVSANAGTYAMPDLEIAWPFGLGDTGHDAETLRRLLEYPDHRDDRHARHQHHGTLLSEGPTVHAARRHAARARAQLCPRRPCRGGGVGNALCMVGDQRARRRPRWATHVGRRRTGRGIGAACRRRQAGSPLTHRLLPERSCRRTAQYADMRSKHMKRRDVLKSAVAGAAALAAPRVVQAEAARTINFTPHADLASLDPVWTTADITRNFSLAVYDTLYGYDADFNVQPQMVEGHVVSNDGKQWDLTLRDGLTFHDGTPVLARDCAATIQRFSKRNPFGGSLMKRTDEVSAPSDKVIRFRLNKPFPLLPNALAEVSCAIMPERLAKTDANTQISEAMGSGPFKFVAVRARSRLSAWCMRRTTSMLPARTASPASTPAPRSSTSIAWCGISFRIPPPPRPR